MITSGYLKDIIACTLFIIIFFIVFFMENINKYKIFFLINILLAIFIDGLYSFYPSYHNTELGYNYPSYLLLIVIVCFLINISLLFFYPNLFKIKNYQE
jgi:phosphatidylglycerophosphate synthase